jgi:Radical SAM superfamily/Radical SAM proteins, N-terminal
MHHASSPSPAQRFRAIVRNLHAPSEHFHRLLHRLRDFRLFLANPTFGNMPWEKSRFHALIVRLSPFADVERSTPHVFLAREIRSALPDAYIDMAFLPRDEDARVLEEAGLPLLIGTQSHRVVEDFELVFVSNAWLLEQVNLPFLLLHSGVPLWAGTRGEQWPPFILGGSNSTAAHALVSETGDCMADAIFFGEGEGSAGRIAAMSSALRGVPKQERVRRIASEVPGLWPAGSFAVKVRRTTCPDSQTGGEGTAAPIMPGPESATARISITRGCPCFCSFCYEGHDRKPFRQIPASEILREARGLKLSTGADTLEVESFNFNTHSEIAALLHALNLLFHRVNLMSQRVDILARTPGLLDLEIAADKTSFTLGVEGISGKTRSFLRKSLEESDIRSVLEALHARRIREVKLFYLLNGRESSRDFEEFTDFVKWLKQLRMKASAPPRVLFSFGMLVRMPLTPLRYDPPVLDEQAWRQQAGRAKSICETNGFEFRLAMPWSEYEATQALALGGHSVHSLLERIARAGCVAGRGLPRETGPWAGEWLAAHGAELGGEKPRDRLFAFPFLEDERTTASLHAQYEEARAARDPGYCRRGVEGTHECAMCPGCTRNPRRAAGGSGVTKAAAGLASLMRKKHHLKPLHMRARIPREAAGLGARWAEAWLMRKLLERLPAQLENVLAVREVLAGASGVLGEETPWYGQTIAAVTAWDTETLADLREPDGGTFGPVEKEWEPGVFHALRMRVEVPSSLFPHAPENLAVFLRDAHAPVTLSRAGGVQRLVPADRALKKRMLREGTCVETRSGWILDLVVGPKFSLGQWLQSSGGKGAARAALVEVTEIT